MAALAYFGATLTLPGIAGIILTIGMAVDSNVLIFERIREELRAGKIDSGGRGRGLRQSLVDDRRYPRHHHRVVPVPVHVRNRSGEGFAVTLVIGLLANVFTAVFVSKAIFDWELSGAQAGYGVEHLMMKRYRGCMHVSLC